MEKQEKIDYIKKVVNEWGSFNVNEVEGEEDIFLSGGKDDQWMIDGVSGDGVKTTHYIHGSDVNYDDVEFENLPEPVFNEVCRLVENYEAEQEKTWKRCQN